MLGALLATGCAAQTSARPVRTANQVAAANEEDALSERVDAFGKLLREQGFVTPPQATRGFLPPSARDTQAVALPAETCALFVALASPTVEDLDAAVYTPEGRVLVEDEGSDARPVLTLCTGKVPLALYFSVHAYQGAGAFVTRVFLRPRGAEDRSIEPADTLASSLYEQTRELHKRGFQDDAPPVELTVGTTPVRLAVPVRSGECYSLLAEATERADLALRLLDAQGREVALGLGDGSVAALQHCARESGDYGLELAADGEGASVRVARLHAPESAIGGVRALWLGEPSPSAERYASSPKSKREVEADLRAAGERLVQFESVPLEQGRLRELTWRAPTSRCERIDVALSGGLVSARVRVEGEGAARLAEQDVPAAGAHVALCDRKGPARVVLIGLSGFGVATVTGAATTR